MRRKHDNQRGKQMTTEATPEGEQHLIDGVRPITERERLEARQSRPLQGKSAPMDKGLFDLGARAQSDWLS